MIACEPAASSLPRERAHMLQMQCCALTSGLRHRVRRCEELDALAASAARGCPPWPCRPSCEYLSSKMATVTGCASVWQGVGMATVGSGCRSRAQWSGRHAGHGRFKLWAWALQAHRLLGEDVSSSCLVASAGQRSVFTTICEGARDESEHSSRARGSWSPSRSTGRRMGSGRARKGGASGVSRTAYQRAVNLSLYRLAHRRAQSRGLPFFSDDVTFEREVGGFSRASSFLARGSLLRGGNIYY